MESAQYLYMDIHTMDGFFNWTMTYRKDSDFYRPYGRIVQVFFHLMKTSPIYNLTYSDKNSSYWRRVRGIHNEIWS